MEIRKHQKRKEEEDQECVKMHILQLSRVAFISKFYYSKWKFD